MSSQDDKTKGNPTETPERGPREAGQGARFSPPKFIQRRGARGFNNQPPPTRLPRLTPAPPPPKWSVPAEARKA